MPTAQPRAKQRRPTHLSSAPIAVPRAIRISWSGMAFSTETDELVGTVVPADAGGADYLFESKLGVGGTSAAYLAQRISSTGRSPAVMKVILPMIVDRQGATAPSRCLGSPSNT